jgi:O-antigen/teichoic acid export membrane protein
LTDNIEQVSLLKRILGAMFNFGVSNVMTKIIGFLLIPVYTQYLTPDDYGIVELCGALSAFVIIFMRLGVPGAVNRFYFDYKNEPEKLNDYVTTIHHLLVFSSIILALVVGIVMYVFSDTMLSGILFFPFIVLTIINAGFSANSDLQKRLLQSKEKSAYMAKLNISLALVGIGLALLFVVVFKMGALGLMLSQSATTFVFFIQAQYYLRNYLKGKFNWGMLKDSLKYGAGLLPHHLFAVLAPLMSKGILNSKESLAALGIFALAIRFTQPLDILYNIFTISFNPIYFSLRKNQENQKIRIVYRSVWYISIGVFMLVAIILPSIIPLITPERFHQSAHLIPILALGFLGQVLYSLFLIENYYDKNTKHVSLVTGSGLAINLLVTLLTVDRFGVYAVAIASAAGFITWSIMGYILSKKHFLNYIDLKTIAKGLLIITPVFALAMFTPIDAFIIRFSLMALGFGTIVLFNYKNFVKILSIIRNREAL